jgi:hypothetical protein
MVFKEGKQPVFSRLAEHQFTEIFLLEKSPIQIPQQKYLFYLTFLCVDFKTIFCIEK